MWDTTEGSQTTGPGCGHQGLKGWREMLVLRQVPKDREEGGRCPVIEAETWGPRAAHRPADVRDKQARGGHPETAPCLLLPQTCGPQ